MDVIELENGISYNVNSDYFVDGIPANYFAKYLKGVYRNIERLDEHFSSPLRESLIALDKKDRIYQIDMIRTYFEKVNPFTYREAFELKNQNFRAMVFGSINVGEMINNLGSKRISTEGKNVTHRFYKEDGSYEMRNYDVIYELYEIDCTELGVENNYCVKCWCTSTNKEHWLWVEEEYANKGPLEAIASTIRVYENMIPHIKYIKRQGDVILFEMERKINPSGNIVPLTAEQYFSKLIAQS